jgi:hypothetical protein
MILFVLEYFSSTADRGLELFDCVAHCLPAVEGAPRLTPVRSKTRRGELGLCACHSAKN